MEEIIAVDDELEFETTPRKPYKPNTSLEKGTISDLMTYNEVRGRVVESIYHSGVRIPKIGDCSVGNILLTNLVFSFHL